jgi:molybdopterin molybdotransferase
MRQDFLETKSRREVEALLAEFAPVDLETVAYLDARGRVLAEDLVSPEDLPTGSRSSMDGYALSARDAFGASESNPAYLECVRTIEVNRFPDFVLASGECAWIPTGGFLPQGADSVVMVEYTDRLGGATIEIRQSVAPGENVMAKGEDAAAGQVVLRAGIRLRAQEVGLLAALGITSVRVFRRPKVAILSTGDELVPVEERPAPGQIRDVNSHTVATLVEEAGGEAVRCGLVKDDLEGLTEAVARALQDHDLVILSGGSSKGMGDVTIEALEAIEGSEILVHGIRLSPGKPTILARIGDRPVLGLPGQAGSAQVVMAVLGEPLLRRLGGDARAFDEEQRSWRRARLARNVGSRQGREDYVRVRLEAREGDLPLAHPVMGKSGLLRTLLQSDGLLRIPEEAEGVREGAEVDIWLL